MPHNSRSRLQGLQLWRVPGTGCRGYLKKYEHIEGNGGFEGKLHASKVSEGEMTEVAGQRRARCGHVPGGTFFRVLLLAWVRPKQEVSPQLAAASLDSSLGHFRQALGSDQYLLKRVCFFNVLVCPGNEI